MSTEPTATSTSASVAATGSPMSPFDRHLGITKEIVQPDLVVITMPVTEHHLQPQGFVHGGVYCTLSETAASIGGILNSPTGAAVGQSNHTDFIKASQSSMLRATATPVQIGRRVQLWDVVITDDADETVAVGRVRLYSIKAR